MAVMIRQMSHLHTSQGMSVLQLLADIILIYLCNTWLGLHLSLLRGTPDEK